MKTRPFKIFFVENENGKEVKKEIHRFESENYDSAYEYYKNYVKNNASKHKLYVEMVHLYMFSGYDGSVISSEKFIDDVELSRQLNETKKNLSIKKRMKLVIDDIWFSITNNVHTITSFFKRSFKRSYFLAKNKHFMNESWDLSIHMLKDLKFNLKFLRDSSVGVSMEFIDLAIKKLHENEPDFDFEKYKAEYPYGSTKELGEVDDLATKIRFDVYTEIIENIDMYLYYSGYFDENDPEYIKRSKIYRFPKIKGTYDKIDYDLAFKIGKKYWNKVWELVREFGITMCD